MKRDYGILIFVFITKASLLFAQSTTIIVDMDDFDAQYEAMFEEIEGDFESFSDSLDVAFEEYSKKIEAEYEMFEQKLAKTWGEGNVRKSDKYNWVEYSDDYKSRSVVDFENGEATVEVLVTDEELKNKSLVDKKLAQSFAHLLDSKARTVEYKSDYIPQRSVEETPIMNNLIADTKDGALSKPIDNKAKSQKIVEKEPSKVVKPKANSGYNIVSTTTKLASNYLPERAKVFEDLVLQNAKRFNISPALIYGIMEVESSFSPTAGSNMGALGLMQIVPRSAGRDTYKYLYGVDKLLNQSYLFQPDKNIEMGVAYLKILETRYFKNVEDARCRELCMIAAYNTGPGNVSRAMAGHTNVFKVIPQINNMSYDQLFSHFRKKLPSSETRNYIHNVTVAKNKYTAH